MGWLPARSSSRPRSTAPARSTAFFRLAIPMSVPAIAALVIFQFLFVWNDLLVALIYLGATNSENLPLTVALANLANSLGGGWQFLMAGGLHLDGAAARRLLRPPAVLRPRHHRRSRQGLTGRPGGCLLHPHSPRRPRLLRLEPAGARALGPGELRSAPTWSASSASRARAPSTTAAGAFDVNASFASRARAAAS